MAFSVDPMESESGNYSSFIWQKVSVFLSFSFFNDDMCFDIYEQQHFD